MKFVVVTDDDQKRPFNTHKEADDFAAEQSQAGRTSWVYEQGAGMVGKWEPL